MKLSLKQHKMPQMITSDTITAKTINVTSAEMLFTTGIDVKLKI